MGAEIWLKVDDPAPVDPDADLRFTSFSILHSQFDILSTPARPALPLLF